MNATSRDQLLEELADLVVVKVALILVPVRELLQVSGRQELARTMESIIGGLETELAEVVSNYEVQKKH